MTEPKVSGADLHRQPSTDGSTDAGSSGSLGGVLDGLPINRTHVFLIVILVAIGGILYFGRRFDDETTGTADTADTAEADVEEELDDLDDVTAEPEEDINIEHDPSDPLKADRQALAFLDGRRAS